MRRLEKLREGWGLVWTWTVLNALGIVTIGSTLPELFSDWTLVERVLVLWVFACWAAGQAWLLRLRCSGPLIWAFGWAFGLMLPISNPFSLILGALAVVLVVQTTAIHMSRDTAAAWVLLNVILFLACCAGAIASTMMRELFIDEVSLPVEVSRFVASDMTIAIGWSFLFLIVQGMILAFLIPARDAGKLA